MKRALLIILLITFFPFSTFSAIQEEGQILQATTAALVVQSLQLGEKAQQLFSIKDELIKMVKTKKNNFTSQDDMMIDAATEMKYIATVAYFEGNLLGAVLALKKEFKLHFINDRILELDNAIKGTISSLKPIQIAHSRIDDGTAKHQLDRSIKVVQALVEIYRNSIRILEKIREKEFGEIEIKEPGN